MSEFGFPAQPRFDLMRRTIADLRRRADDARTAAVTGRFADVTSVRKGRVNEIMQIEKSIGDLRSYAETIALAEARASVTQQSLGQIVGLGQSLAYDAARLIGTGTDANLANISVAAAGSFDAAVAALNVDFAGRALFAGDEGGGSALASAASIIAAATPVLEAGGTAAAGYAALEAEFMDPGGFFETAAYLGGAGDAPAVEAAPGERVDYGVKADEAPLRRALFNVAVMALAFDSANSIPDAQRRGLLERGADGLRSAIGEVVSLQGRLGAAEERIGAVKARNIAAEAMLGIRYNDLAGADTYTEAVTLSELENHLEAAFATTARLTQLSLANRL